MPAYAVPAEVFHFSEDATLGRFEPRLLPSRPEVAEPLVWAVDAPHAFTYCFPRDCPRILLWSLPTSTEADRRHWLGATPARAVAYIEYAWLDRVREAVLHRYRLPAASFVPAGDLGGPGNYVSRQAVTALGVDPVTDLVEALRLAGVELRVIDRLGHLRGAWDSSLHVSGIRLRNALDWPA